jgi:hypothetical protein
MNISVRSRPVHALEQPTKVRGRPFQPGNPGRSPGSKNRTTQLVEQLVAGEAEQLTRKMIELAKAGNVRCLEYCLDRVLPKRSGRPLDFQLPTINNARDLMAAMAAITTAANNGDISAEEASYLVRFLEGCANIITTNDFAVRLEALESWMKEKGYNLTPSQRITKFGMGSSH